MSLRKSFRMPEIWAFDDLEIPVLCDGVRTDFQGNLFPGSAALLGWADNLTELKTFHPETGGKALNLLAPRFPSNPSCLYPSQATHFAIAVFVDTDPDVVGKGDTLFARLGDMITVVLRFFLTLVNLFCFEHRLFEKRWFGIQREVCHHRSFQTELPRVDEKVPRLGGNILDVFSPLGIGVLRGVVVKAPPDLRIVGDLFQRIP